MADNNQQWEELDYSDENPEEYEESEYEEDDSSASEEYEDEEQSDEYEEEYEYEDDEDSSEQGKNNNSVKIIIAVLLLLLLGGGAFFAAKSLSGNKGESVASEVKTEHAQSLPAAASGQDDSFFETSNDGGQDLMNVSFNENGDTNINDEQNTGDVVTVSDAQGNDLNDDLFINSALEQNQENDSIMVSYNQAARLNPFKPPVAASFLKPDSPYAVIDDTQFEIIEPPVSSVPDENLTRLLQTQISGIMYDPESPSAIINLNGTDYFVKIGDKVAGYIIKDITRDRVQVNYKSNTYVASVGQLFTRGVLEHPNVADFEHKFAGRNRNNSN